MDEEITEAPLCRCLRVLRERSTFKEKEDMAPSRHSLWI